MIVLTTGKNVSVTVRDIDLFDNRKRFYAFCNAGYFDPENKFKPCFEGAAERRRLYDGYIEEYKEMLADAEKQFDKIKSVYENKMNAQRKPEPNPVERGGGLGSQLEEMLLKVLAEQSVDKVLDVAKPMLEKHIVETFGVLPQVHEVRTPAETHKIEGIVHEKFDTVLNLVSADIPVFLTGPAGTGKNVICKQVADSLGLEFYFSNAVTQEYKITGFIDANGHYHGTQFYEAFTKGGLFMLDEMDGSIPEVLIMLNAAIANRYFDFPTGRFEANENFRIIAAGNTFGTGADIEYTGRYQLDAASLDRFALVEVDYSKLIEDSIARGDDELTAYIRAFRAAASNAGIKHLATYRSIERIKKLDGIVDTGEALKAAFLKGLSKDDMKVLFSEMDRKLSTGTNRYYKETKNLFA